MALLAALALVVAACGNDDDGGDDTADEAAAETPTDGDDTGATGTGETVTIAASVPPTDHGWLGQIAAKAQEAAAQFDDVNFRLVEADDADDQAAQIQTLINERPDAIVVHQIRIGAALEQ